MLVIWPGGGSEIAENLLPIQMIWCSNSNKNQNFNYNFLKSTTTWKLAAKFFQTAKKILFVLRKKINI